MSTRKALAIDRDIAQLKESGVEFRNEIIQGPGGRQNLILDPSGNLVELFEPTPET